MIAARIFTRSRFAAAQLWPATIKRVPFPIARPLTVRCKLRLIGRAPRQRACAGRSLAHLERSRSNRGRLRRSSMRGTTGKKEEGAERASERGKGARLLCAKRQRRVLIRTSVLNLLTRGALKTRPLTRDDRGGRGGGSSGNGSQIWCLLRSSSRIRTPERKFSDGAP